MEKLLISACLLGTNCKYDGTNNYIDTKKLKDHFIFYPICPEVDGGLSTPRIPSERKGSIVINAQNDDVTKNYELGKNKAIELAKKEHIRYALLKRKSPSCGNDEIYDGTFTHTTIKRPGVTAEALMQIDVQVFNENEIDKLLELGKKLSNRK